MEKEKDAEERKALIRASEKAARKRKQQALAERWKTIRWLADFVDKNTEKWEENKNTSSELNLEIWDSLGEIERISILKEKMKLKRKTTDKKDDKEDTIRSEPSLEWLRC